MSERPTKRVFIPQPQTEGEQLAWGVADANSQVIKNLHDQLTAAQQRVASLELDLKVQADNVAHFKQVIEQETKRAD